MWSFVYPLNSSYKYAKKVKLNPNQNPNVFSEIIELQENGSSRGIPNWPIYIGIAALCIVRGGHLKNTPCTYVGISIGS